MTYRELIDHLYKTCNNLDDAVEFIYNGDTNMITYQDCSLENDNLQRMYFLLKDKVES